MKTLKLFTLLFVSVFIFSCKKDDPKDLILGEWKASKIVTSGCTDPTDNQNLTFTNGCYTETLLGIELCLTLNFKNDGTYITTTKSTFLGTPSTETETGTYTIDGSNIKLCTGGSCDNASFTVSDKSLNIKGKDTDSGCNNDLTLIK